jgi:hypothetical protein
MIKCCDKNIEIKRGKQNGKELFYAECVKCGKKFKSENKKEVENYFQKKEQVEYELQPMPKDHTQIMSWGKNNIQALMRQSAQFIDKPATQRMIEKNLRYVASLAGKTWDKIWSTKEGQESIKYAMTEANYYAATLGEMGDIVPYGSSCEFIPSVECFKFALESGRNAPFRDISIDLIHENDQTENYQKDGNFEIEIKRGIPRGDILAVAVTAIRTDNNKRIGEIYDVDRLLEKARVHSPAYRMCLANLAEFKKMQIEGKLQNDEQGDYFLKKIEYFKEGKKQSYEKKIYELDITNPYDGPDRPEMLRKAAGKSFFRPYMRVRNASAMVDEWEEESLDTREDVADAILSRASGQFDEEKITDAEIIEEEQKEEQKEENDKKLFNG